jgi:hypothetical protein
MLGSYVCDDFTLRREEKLYLIFLTYVHVHWLYTEFIDIYAIHTLYAYVIHTYNIIYALHYKESHSI